MAYALSDPDHPIEDLYVEMIANSWADGGKAHHTVASAARDMLNRPDEERGSVLSTAMSFLSLYRVARRQECGPLGLQCDRSYEP